MIRRKAPIGVRPVQRGDFPAWLSLRRSLWPGPRGSHLAEMQSFFGKRGFACWLAWSGRKAVGFAEAAIRPYANGCRSRPVPFLEGLFVAAPFRRKRAGRALVMAVEAWARGRSFRELGWDAYLSNRLSHKAHLAYGFRETERVVYFRKSLRPSGTRDR